MDEATLAGGNLPYQVRLEVFEGPLDLLLHLIKKNEVSVYDIPVALLTEQYLEYLELMKSLNLDIAGEFLAMAATLMYIKSRLLLPAPPGEEGADEEMSLEALQRQLVEYQRYKEMAQKLESREVLGRDVFVRPPIVVEEPPPEAMEIEEVSLFDLIEALQEVIKRLPDKSMMEVSSDTISIKDKIQEILERLRVETRLTFLSLFSNVKSREEVVVIFLALLELAKQQMIKLFQGGAFQDITVVPAVALEAGGEPQETK